MSKGAQSESRGIAEDPERLRLEFWPISRLIPSPRNARTHSEAQIAEIAGSIRTFGFTNPILVGNDGDVIAGHGWYAVRTKGHWTGDRKQTTLWTIPSRGQDTDTIHGTQKPVECMRRPMLNN